MAKFNIVNISEFKLGTPEVDGSLPDTWEDNLNVKEGTCNITIPETETTAQYNEQSRVPFHYSEGNIGEPMIEGMLSEALLEKVSPLFGGTYTAADATNPETMKLTSAPETIYRAIYLKGKTTEGKDIIVGVPNAMIKMAMTGTITKTDVTGVNFKGMVLNPTVGNDFIHIQIGQPTA